jgi:hypothetical protein
MTETQFDNGYWYATEIKAFANEIGIPHASKLRKDELEKLIRHFLRTGKVISSTRKNILKPGIKDIDKGLKLSLPVINYTSNKITKYFIVNEALKQAPGLKKKSGARYRLNRWRDEQVTRRIKITYGEIVKKYIELNQAEGSFKKAPSGRYINFLSDYLKNEKNAKRSDALKIWKSLKSLDIPKDYRSWKKLKNKM